MNEPQEDYNAFNSWDNFGATLMMCSVPAVMNFVFTKEHDIFFSLVLAGIGLLVSLVVLVLSLVTRWRIIGAFVNLAGMVLTGLFWAYASYCWWIQEDTPAEPAATEQPAKQKA
ncbi:MAG: hypothetical protein IKA23_09170 [Akkermansia sp.]|nr:hypothetical protein [Akkermansia sp.]